MNGPRNEREMQVWLLGFRAGYCSALNAVEIDPKSTPKQIKEFWLRGWDYRVEMLKSGVTYNEIKDEIEAT